MRHFNIGGVKYSWQPEARVLRNTFEPGTVATRPKGVQVVKSLKKWLGDSQEKYALLCSGAGVQDIDLGYRQEFAELFVEYPNVVLAVYNFPIEIEQVPILFAVATEINLKGFNSEAEAEEWVRSFGFDV